VHVFNHGGNRLFNCQKTRRIPMSVSDPVPVAERIKTLWQAKNRAEIGISARFMEAAGIEPASRDVSRLASTCVVADLKFAQSTGRRHPEKWTSLKLCLVASVSDVTYYDLELMTSIQSSPAEPISRGFVFLRSQCERVIFSN